MADKSQNGITMEQRVCVTPTFRCAFVALDQPVSYMNNKPSYQVIALWPKNMDLGVPVVLKGVEKENPSVRRAIKRAKIAQFGKDEKAWKGLDDPIKSGDEKKTWEGFEGMKYARLSAKEGKVIALYDRQGNLTTDTSIFYSGCKARAKVMACGYDEGSKGVKLILQALVFVGDDKPFGGAVKAERAESDFGALDEFIEDQNDENENDDSDSDLIGGDDDD